MTTLPSGKTHTGVDIRTTRIIMSSTPPVDSLLSRLRFLDLDWDRVPRSERRSLARKWWQYCTRPYPSWNEAWQYINQRNGMIEPEFLQYRLEK
jgi:hypothetical protein